MEVIEWHTFLVDSVLTDDPASTTTSLEPPFLRSTSPEFNSWVRHAPIARSLVPQRLRRHRRSDADEPRGRLPHALHFRRVDDLRRQASMKCARAHILIDDDPPFGTPWPPGAMGRLRRPPEPRPGAKGLKCAGHDVPWDYAGKKKVWGEKEWFVPELTRLGRDVWTIDEGAGEGFRVDDESAGEEEGPQEKEEGLAVDGEFDIPPPGPSYHGPLREYAGYVSDDSDDDDDSDHEPRSSRLLRLGDQIEQDADEDDDQKTTDAFDDFDGHHTGRDETEPADGSRCCEGSGRQTTTTMSADREESKTDTTHDDDTNADRTSSI